MLLIAVTMVLGSCQDDGAEGTENTEATTEGGAQQVDPPVLNSGAETERDRALNAVEKDTTNKQTHVGKDPNASSPSQKDTTRNK